MICKHKETLVQESDILALETQAALDAAKMNSDNRNVSLDAWDFNTMFAECEKYDAMISKMVTAPRIYCDMRILGRDSFSDSTLEERDAGFPYGKLWGTDIYVSSLISNNAIYLIGSRNCDDDATLIDPNYIDIARLGKMIYAKLDLAKYIEWRKEQKAWHDWMDGKRRKREIEKCQTTNQ